MDKLGLVKLLQKHMKNPVNLAIIYDVISAFPEAIREAMETDGWAEIDRVCAFERYDVPPRSRINTVGKRKGELWEKPAEQWVKIKIYDSFKYMFRKEERK